MTKTELIKKILKLGDELEDAENFGALMVVKEMEQAIDDYTENVVKSSLGDVMDSKGAKEHIEPPKSVIFKGW
jgi:hypothetical protein